MLNIIVFKQTNILQRKALTSSWYEMTVILAKTVYLTNAKPKIESIDCIKALLIYGKISENATF